MDYTIKQTEEKGKGMFYIELEEEMAAQLQYSVEDHGIMTLDHTETHPEMTGKGLAKNLVRHAVEYAREHDLKVDPLCTYAARQFDRHPEYKDIRVD